MRQRARYFIVLTILIIGFSLIFAYVHGFVQNATNAGSHWQLVWSDDFSQERTLDTGKWYAENTGVDSHNNNELEHYVPGEVSVSGGSLVLKSEHIGKGNDYPSGAVNTFGTGQRALFSFLYGRVDIRAKGPKGGKGIWPALWLLGTGCNPNTCNWPAKGSNEIDILELVNDPTTVYMTPHYGDKVNVDKSLNQQCTYTGPNFSTDYHDFSLEWMPGGQLTWYIDRIERCKQTIANYFDTPMYLILNMAIGGTWPGNPDGTTTFPQELSIKYVHVYQMQG